MELGIVIAVVTVSVVRMASETTSETATSRCARWKTVIVQRIMGDVDLFALVHVLAGPSAAAMDRRQCSVHLAGQDSFHSAAAGGPVDLSALVRVLAGPSEAAVDLRQCSVHLAGNDASHSAADATAGALDLLCIKPNGPRTLHECPRMISFVHSSLQVRFYYS